jgi:hypothetical protein
MNSSLVDVQTLASRVEKLEAANRRWKSVSAIALLFVLSLLLLSTRHAERVAAATARPDRVERGVLRVRTVEAQDFVLKDDDGHVYARLSLSPQARVKKNGGSYLLQDDTLPGQPSLQFYNDKGDVVWTAPSAAQLLPAR